MGNDEFDDLLSSHEDGVDLDGKLINEIEEVEVEEENVTETVLKEVDEKVFREYLYTVGIPDPDLLVRTSEKRLSNFMLYQCAYTELCFVDKYWPDFDKAALDGVLEDYANRQRRYGAIKE